MLFCIFQMICNFTTLQFTLQSKKRKSIVPTLVIVVLISFTYLFPIGAIAYWLGHWIPDPEV